MCRWPFLVRMFASSILAAACAGRAEARSPIAAGISAGPSTSYYLNGASFFDRVNPQGGLAARSRVGEQIFLRSGLTVMLHGMRVDPSTDEGRYAYRSVYLSVPLEVEHVLRLGAGVSPLLGVGFTLDRLVKATIGDPEGRWIEDVKDQTERWDLAFVATWGIRPRSAHWDLRFRHTFGLYPVEGTRRGKLNASSGLLLTWWIAR